MRNIRKKNREITREEADRILNRAEFGVLSTVDKNDQPYGVPLSFVYKNNNIYFHCALDGHKIENIENNNRVSFCVVGNTRLLPYKFSTEYESVITFGSATVIEDHERQDALLWLLEKYCSDFIKEGQLYIERMDSATKVVRIEISNICGKARREK